MSPGRQHQADSGRDAAVG
ncbi:hypothetical protein CL3_32770 [butyrate-producing bacterium SM4/1]|nr:hypothetical protein CL3_32770 [butyrate-producing bacterium SM4/1]